MNGKRRLNRRNLHHSRLGAWLRNGAAIASDDAPLSNREKVKVNRSWYSHRYSGHRKDVWGSTGSYFVNLWTHENYQERKAKPMPELPISDPLFRVEVLSATPNPQQVIWAAMHQDYSEGFVADERDRFPDESTAGELIIKHLLKGDRGHYGPIEHPQIVFNVGYFPHSVMQQLRTHRVGVSFDTQSGRYTGGRIVRAARGEIDPGEVFYLRPVGEYRDRAGKRYTYDDAQRMDDWVWIQQAAELYALRVSQGLSEEHARGLTPFDIRQHFVMSCNARSLMHILDLRAKADAQLEIQTLCHMLLPHFKAWAPELAAWYEANRWGKARLSP